MGKEKVNECREYPERHYVDIHCHCLAAVDDGPATEAESLALCRSLVDDGVTKVIATPHQLGQFDGCNEAGQVRENVCILNKTLEKNGIGLTVFPGGDVRVDERMCRLLKADKILTLGDSKKYLLLELPHEIFIDIESLLAELSAMGIQSIISHPERHFALSRRPAILQRWLKYPAYLQVTAGSLLGEFGFEAQEAGWYLLNCGLVSFVATDSHNTKSRRPCLRAAFNRISTELGEAIARQVCIENPLKVLSGEDIASSVCSIDTEKCNDERIRNNF